MAYSVVLLDEARKELADIIEYLEEVLRAHDAANHFVKELDRQIARIADNPTAFALSRIPELNLLQYRTALVESYCLVYNIVGDNVAIAHIFHQTQDYSRLI